MNEVFKKINYTSVSLIAILLWASYNFIKNEKSFYSPASAAGIACLVLILILVVITLFHISIEVVEQKNQSIINEYKQLVEDLKKNNQYSNSELRKDLAQTREEIRSRSNVGGTGLKIRGSGSTHNKEDVY